MVQFSTKVNVLKIRFFCIFKQPYFLHVNLLCNKSRKRQRRVNICRTNTVDEKLRCSAPQYFLCYGLNFTDTDKKRIIQNEVYSPKSPV